MRIDGDTRRTLRGSFHLAHSLTYIRMYTHMLVITRNKIGVFIYIFLFFLYDMAMYVQASELSLHQVDAEINNQCYHEKKRF